MTENLDTPFVILRNEISGVSTEYDPETAKQFLEHPIFGEHLRVVRTAKPEVLKRAIGKDVDFEFEPEAEEASKDEPEAKKETK